MIGTSHNNIEKNQMKFEVIDSLLSELAVLGFEFAALSEPETLVLWEAQFGDFANGGQVIIDQFITSSESNGEELAGLLCCCPTDTKDNSRTFICQIREILQLCAGENIQVVNCTTPSNYFHVLRRQMHRAFRKPLVIMTPKSLLRHKRCVSNLSEFSSKSSFHRVLEDDAYQKNNLIELKKDKNKKSNYVFW